MKRIKRKLGKLLVILCACLSVGAVANAADSMNTDVQIEIEASEEAVLDENTPEAGSTVETVKTGDNMAWIKYLAACGVAGIIAIGCIWKKKKGMFAVFALFLSLLFINDSVHAAETSENVSVTIPTSISISFNETGENSISEFAVHNQSLVPIIIERVNVTERNDWSLTERENTIPVNTKKLVFEIENQCLQAGENIISISVEENSSKDVNINIERGAWTVSNAAETALSLEFEYSLGRKEFKLSYNTNGYDGTIDSQKVCNGDSVQLPVLEREGYDFAGWEDAQGNLYTDKFVMPIGDVTLKASWKEEIAYAIYTASDTTLTFIRSADPIAAGDTYNGKVVTDVFTGFEEDTYASEYEVPWYDGHYYNERVITKIIFEDTIKPKNTAYWFLWTYDCTSMDVRKLDMSNVTDMTYMCGWAGNDASTFSITGVNDWDVSNVTKMDHAFRAMGANAPYMVIDLSGWNVSKVTSMENMFQSIGYFATTFSLGDLSKWDVSNVTSMYRMFYNMGVTASWSLDLSKWNVAKVTNHSGFATAIESKITQPNWKY